jgi:uncharacterized protein (DUF2384 family)
MRKPPDEKNRRLLAKIIEYQTLYSIDDEKLARAMGMTSRTLRNRKTNLDKLTLGELRAISARANIPMSEIVPYI